MARAADPVRAYLESRVARGDFPGAAWASWRAPGRLRIGAVGRRIVTGPRLGVTPATLFDLASLTKPLCTALLALRLQIDGVVDLEAPVRAWLPELGGAHGELSLADLMTHRSGLPAWRPLYLQGRTKDEAVEAIARVAPDARPRTRVIYSDLNFILAGVLVERAYGARLSHLFEAHVARPLGLRRLRFLPPPSWRRACAATEMGNGWERAMVGRRAPAVIARARFRKRLIWGEVHDHNCFTLGGDTGHAGLFGDAASVVRLAAVFLPMEAVFVDRTRATGGHRTLGFQLATDPGSSAGPALSRRAIGHTGFTGTSLWIDPRAEAIHVLLTNRMHPRRSACDMNEVRRQFHRLAGAR